MWDWGCLDEVVSQRGWRDRAEVYSETSTDDRAPEPVTPKNETSPVACFITTVISIRENITKINFITVLFYTDLIIRPFVGVTESLQWLGVDSLLCRYSEDR